MTALFVAMLDLGKVGTDQQLYIPWMQATYIMVARTEALDYLPDGARVILRTYTGVHVLDARTWKQTWSAAIPETRQSESLAAAADGTSVIVGSEGLPSPIMRITLPEDQRAAMLAPASGVFDLD